MVPPVDILASLAFIEKVTLGSVSDTFTLNNHSILPTAAAAIGCAIHVTVFTNTESKSIRSSVWPHLGLDQL